MMKPIRLEIITRVLTGFQSCSHCALVFDQTGLRPQWHQSQMDEYPSDLKEECLKLWDWIRELKRLYKHRLLISLVDMCSPMGMYKSFRYRIRTHPAFVIEGKQIYSGWDRKHLEGLLDQYIKISSPATPRKVRSTLS